jgi:hypothetical protein
MCKDGRWMCLLESMCRRIGWTFVSGQAARPSPSRAMTRVSSVSSSGLRAFDESAPIPCRIVDIDHSRSAGAPASRSQRGRTLRPSQSTLCATASTNTWSSRPATPSLRSLCASPRSKGPRPGGTSARGEGARSCVGNERPLSGPPRASKRRGHPYAFTLAPCHDGVLRPLFRRTPDRRRTRARLRDPATLSIFPLRTRSRPEFPAGEGRRLLCPVDQSAR